MQFLSRTLPRWLLHTLACAPVLVAALAIAMAPVGQPDAQAQGVVQPQSPNGDLFDGGTDWLNTAKPLSTADLRGRVVLLDFWTLC